MRFPNTCILQFAKAPIAGYVKTRLIPVLGPQDALQLHKDLVSLTWESLHAENLAHVQLWVDQPDNEGFFSTLDPAVETIRVQEGKDLGERMSHAIQVGLSQYEQVIVVGSDCPVLDVNYLQEALETLQRGCDVVIGPASDGGYVLIGMRRLYEEAFQAINWGTDQVLIQTRDRLASSHCEWHELPERWDVDRPEDFSKLKALSLF